MFYIYFSFHLTDTESITTIVLQKMLEKYKIQLTEDVRKKTIGYSTSDVYIMFTKIYDISVSYEEFLEDKEHFEKIYMKNIQLMPGIFYYNISLNSINAVICTSLTCHENVMQFQKFLFKILRNLIYHYHDFQNYFKVKLLYFI